MSLTDYLRHKYTPDEIDEEEFLNHFVVRTTEFGELYSKIKKADYSKAQQHFIIIGQRGQGKTTLLRRLMIAVERDKALSKFLIAVKFPEEQYQIRSLCRLWEEVADYLQSLYPEMFSDILDQMETHFEDDDYDLRCFYYLEKHIKTKQKKLLLLIDNIDELLGKLKEKEQRQLREILISSPTFRIIGGSTKMIEQQYDYGKPFFEYFQVVRLQGLDKEDCIRFVRTIGNEKQQKKIDTVISDTPQRLETLRRLTGGVPRTMVMLFDIFLDEDGDAFEDLLKVLDEATPLYKHRMDDLPTTLQDITHVIAMNWDGLGTKEIAAKTRLQSKEVSAQLKQLENKYGIVESISVGKNKVYKLEERFFNIWYLMRFGRKKDRQKVEWLVRFLNSWCSPEELEQRAQSLLQAVSKGNVKTSHAYHMCEALGYAGLSPKTEYLMKKEVRDYLKNKGSDLARNVSSSDSELIGKAHEFYEQGLIDQAIDLLEKSKDENTTIWSLLGFLHGKKDNYTQAEYYYLKAIEHNNIDALNNLAILYEEHKNYTQAEKHFLKAITHNNIFALHNLGLMYSNQKNYAQAEHYLLKAIEHGNNDALNILGSMYAEQKKYEQAEHYLLKAVEHGNSDALNNLGFMYATQKNYTQAEHYLLKAIEHGSNDALNNLGGVYAEQKNYIQAEHYLLKAIEQGITDTLYNLALIYISQNNYAQAEYYLLKAIESGDTKALNNLGGVYAQQENYSKAERYLLKAIESGYSIALYNLGLMYKRQGDHTQAEHYLLKAINNGVPHANIALSGLYLEQGKNIETAIQEIKRSYTTNKQFANTYIYACVLLWAEKFKSSYDTFSEWLQFDSAINTEDHLTFYFLLLMAKGQYYQAKAFLEMKEYQLKDRLKPVWYTLMTLLQDDFPNEIKKMGAELQETVEEMQTVVKAMEKKYAID